MAKGRPLVGSMTSVRAMPRRVKGFLQIEPGYRAARGTPTPTAQE